MNIDNKHVVITGASSGIGAALAREFHRAGACVTLVARREPLLAALTDELGKGSRYLVRDVTAGDPEEWLGDAESSGPIDVFVNNAGINEPGPFAFLDPRVGKRTIEVDLLAPLALAGVVVPRMLARRAGVLVNVSSVAALVPPAGMTWYAAAKGGLAGFSECLAAELTGTGVEVLTVYPGPIDNGAPQATYDLYGRASVAARLPVGKAAALAKQIRLAVLRRRRRLIYPRFYAPARWLPSLVRWLVDRGTPGLPALPGVRTTRSLIASRKEG
jgi:short-subunit dehydrogenase